MLVVRVVVLDNQVHVGRSMQELVDENQMKYQKYENQQHHLHARHHHDPEKLLKRPLTMDKYV